MKSQSTPDESIEAPESQWITEGFDLSYDWGIKKWFTGKLKHILWKLEGTPQCQGGKETQELIDLNIKAKVLCDSHIVNLYKQWYLDTPYRDGKDVWMGVSPINLRELFATIVSRSRKIEQLRKLIIELMKQRDTACQKLSKIESSMLAQQGKDSPS